MKILHTVEYYYPSIGGAQEVVRILSERMVRMGHDVTVATTKLPHRNFREHNGVKIVEFDIHGNAARGIVGEKEKYQDFLLNSSFDVIMNYAAQEWTADLFFEVMDNVKAVKVFVPCGYSALYDPDYAQYFKKLPNALRKYDATVYLSNEYQDIVFARKHKLENIHVIPNGADENEFDDYNARKIDSFRAQHGIGGILFATLGNHTGEKGHREAIEAFKHLPLFGASTLVIIGGGKRDEGCWQYCHEQAKEVNSGLTYSGKRIVLIEGGNREETITALKASDIFVFLSNVECSPLVLFESIAAGVPFVATPAGNDAEIARWTGGGVIVKAKSRPNSRVTARLGDTVWQLTKLSYSKSKRKALGEAGRAAWAKSYTWQVLTNEYVKLYETLLERSR